MLGRWFTHGSSDPDEFLWRAFSIVLGRDASPDELRSLRAAHDSGGPSHAVQRLLSSLEFHLMYSGWRDDIGSGKDPISHERSLERVGPNDPFVRMAYECLLGRDADPGALTHYVERRAAGAPRRHLVRILVMSDEFEARYAANVAKPSGGFVPRDVQLCELANPAKWDNPEWIRLLRSLHALPHDKVSMHRKGYEWTQLLFGLHRLGRINEEASVLSVGAGHECVLYWLANHVGRVVATDTYEGRWQTAGALEGDERVIERPEDYAPFPYRTDHLSFQRMDGRALDFAPASFDIVYSLSSIEHFGGFEGARAAVVEMTRVLKPGGILAIATEYILSGPAHEEAFHPREIHALFDAPDLRLVAPIDERVYDRYDFRPVDVEKDPNQQPHMVVQVGDTVFTSVMVFLEKRQ